MPKGKKKKQRRPQVPALSRGDKAIYNVLAALSMPVGFAVMALYVAAQRRMTVEAGLLAASRNFLGGALLFVFLSVHVGIFQELKRCKVHLFGRKDITYGPPQWREAYPVFRKHPRVSRKPKELRKLRLEWAGYLALWAAVLVFAWMTFFPRTVLLTDGTVKAYDKFDRETVVCEADTLAQLRFETELERVGRRYGSHWEPRLLVRLTDEDGAVYLFDQSDLNNSRLERQAWLTALVELKGSLPPERVAAYIEPKATVEKLIHEGNYTAEEAALLYRLFGP